MRDVPSLQAAIAELIVGYLTRYDLYVSKAHGAEVKTGPAFQHHTL